MSEQFTFPEKNELTTPEYQEKKLDEVYLWQKEWKLFLENSKSWAQLSDGSFYVKTWDWKDFLLKIQNWIVYEKSYRWIHLSEDFKVEWNKIIYWNWEKYIQNSFVQLSNNEDLNSSKIITNLINKIGKIDKKYDELRKWVKWTFTRLNIKLTSEEGIEKKLLIEQTAKKLLKQLSIEEYIEITNIDDSKIQYDLLYTLSKNKDLSTDDYTKILSLKKDRIIKNVVYKVVKEKILSNNSDIFNIIDFLELNNIYITLSSYDLEKINNYEDIKLITWSKYIEKGY